MGVGNFVAGGAVGAIVAFLLAQGFTKIANATDKNGDTIITGLNPDGKPISVKIKNEAIISPQYDIVKVSEPATQLTEPNTASYTLDNQSSVIKRILAISFIPDATMQLEGLMKIKLNETTFFPISQPVQGAFLEDVDVFTVPIPDNYGLKILPKNKLELFIWNPSGNAVSGTFAVFIGELP